MKKIMKTEGSVNFKILCVTGDWDGRRAITLVVYFVCGICYVVWVVGPLLPVFFPNKLYLLLYYLDSLKTF